ncbi:hypothetical protein [Pseudomonas sp. GM49]|uniref:hypothetical protein n=1 Tax=Pseudomonas sp. GM49 TaxID=1144331 RepID=UPI0012FC756F|nr:hypothetical protein [Pseudomonas sp. GM49]
MSPMLGEVKAVRISAIHEPAIAGDDGSGEVQDRFAVSTGGLVDLFPYQRPALPSHRQCFCGHFTTFSFCVAKAVLKNVIYKKYFT